MGQGRFGHDRILSGVIVCHVVGNNGVFPERGSRGPCVGFWGPGSIWQRMWYFCAKFLWIKGVFYHGLCVIIYAGRIVPCLHWYLIRVIGRMTSLEWFSIWETSNNIINFNDVRKRLWKLVSMMMFSPCVFCVLPCVTSTFTVSKRQPNNTVGAAAVHPDDELPTERWTHENKANLRDLIVATGLVILLKLDSNWIFGKFFKFFGLYLDKKIYSSRWILSIFSTDDH